ncbi:hypothetical protein [Geitlerinema sp. PCC 7407]|uniref:hypothetical protein n=1 Tax=Geitlerinema sp. PCC 7407 TaxID=1173025 RepID=UPI00029FD264|nr:hypothetical protein [Geitlerinema sp. PCC 7407]AFY65128.1 hypothetical protein GEI7407_0630 [Geitlerinema sp. PCC 7407]
MKKVLGSFKQIVIVFLAGVLLLVSTACGQDAGMATKGLTNGSNQPETELYRPRQAKEGGMNVYPDTDPRRDTSRAAAKADKLVKNAKQQAQQTDGLGGVFANIRSNAEPGETAEQAARSVKQTAQDATQGAQRGARNLQENARNAGENVTKSASRSVKDAADAIEDKVQSDVKTTRRAVEDAADAIQNKA